MPEMVSFNWADAYRSAQGSSADSFLQYNCRRCAADGKTPTVNSPCECHYAGTLIDGTEFDSSYKRGAPLTFAPNQVIKGW